MIHPEISVVMPVYNAAATLGATIASIQAQSLTSFELIAVDDGSSDESLALLLEHAVHDNRIRVVSEPNGGVSSARNHGANLAKASLVAFIDADDIWAPSKLATHLALHHGNPALAGSYARIAFIAEDATGFHDKQTTSSLRPHTPQLIDVLEENPLCTASNLVVRRDWFLVCGGFDPHLAHAGDQEFIAHLVSSGGRFNGLDKVLVGYRTSPGGLSMDHDRMRSEWRVVAERYLDAPATAPLEALCCRHLARQVLRCGGKPATALHLALAGLWLDAAAFLRDSRRGLSTLAGVFAYPFIPATLRKRLFA